MRPCLAKPSGILLAAHRDHVLREAQALLQALPFLTAKYARLVPGSRLDTQVTRAAWFHDEGKRWPRWQQACRDDYEAYQAWRRRNRLDPEGTDPEDYARYEREERRAGRTPGRHLLAAGVRHEFASLLLSDRFLADRGKPGLSFPERVALAAHHAKLSRRHEGRWTGDEQGAFRAPWTDFCNESYHVPDDFGVRLRRRYETAGVRALLRLADTRASRRESGQDCPEVRPFAPYRLPEGWTERPVQRLARAQAHAPITILRAPTGSGKTEAALLWATEQVRAGRADRLVIAMPTRFTSNALSLNISERIADTGLYHSSAWFARYAHSGDPAREELRMAKLLATPATVCTVDHLLIALTGTREDHYATFFFLAHSAVVLDEVDFYDPFVQANLHVLLTVLRLLDVPVLLMSATVPEAARVYYDVPTPIAEAPEGQGGRRFILRHPPVETPDDAADVLRAMLEAGTGIVYANTVERAYRFYQWLEKNRSDPTLRLVLYHSRFTEPDKLGIEGTLKQALGTEAWQNGSARGIAVLTQIGEMSVNISAPLMYSDTCPWDRLAQRLGRLSRFDPAEEGTCHVADPLRDGRFYPAPYGTFVQRRGWEAGAAIEATRSHLDAMEPAEPWEATPGALVAAVDRLYPEPVPPGPAARANATAYRRMISETWLIAQATAADEDTGEVEGQWRSRDIPAQTTILVAVPDDPGDGPDRSAYPFRSWEEWHHFVLENGVGVPHYLIRRGLGAGLLGVFSYTVGDDREVLRAYFCPEYDRETGLAMLAVRTAEDTPRDEPAGTRFI